jgi:hypothetical protein
VSGALILGTSQDGALWHKLFRPAACEFMSQNVERYWKVGKEWHFLEVPGILGGKRPQVLQIESLSVTKYEFPLLPRFRALKFLYLSYF